MSNLYSRKCSDTVSQFLFGRTTQQLIGNSAIIGRVDVINHTPCWTL